MITPPKNAQAASHPAVNAARARFVSMGGDPGGPVVLPRELGLGPLSPNPFDRSATVEFRMAREGTISLDLYDMLGRHIANVASGFQGKGIHRATLALPPNESDGAYILRLRAGDDMVAEKIVRITGGR